MDAAIIVQKGKRKMRSPARLSAFALALLLCLSSVLPALADVPVVFMKDDTSAPYETVEYVSASPFAPDADTLKVDIVGIRQGDCIVVTCGEERMLVDGGESFRFQAVTDYFADHGITRFDLFFLTHHHDDHIELQRRLVNHDFPVDRVMAPYDGTETAATWRDYSSLLAQKGIPVVTVRNGDEFTLGGAHLKVYRNEAPGLSVNAASTALMVTFGEARIFLGADITGDSQHVLAEKYGDELDCDILKACHHGNTPTVPEMLDALSPSLSVITNNRSYTMENDRQLDRRDIPRYYITRTIHLETDGHTWFVWTEKMR